MLWGHEHVAVDEIGQAAADQRSDPVDPVAVEVAADDGGAEGASGVHGSAGEWASIKDVGADDEPDDDGGNYAERALLGVGGDGVHVMTLKVPQQITGLGFSACP